MEIGYVRPARMSKERQDMRFSLRQPAFPQIVKIKTDSVRRTVDWMNKSQWHRL